MGSDMGKEIVRGSNCIELWRNSADKPDDIINQSRITSPFIERRGLTRLPEQPSLTFRDVPRWDMMEEYKNKVYPIISKHPEGGYLVPRDQTRMGGKDLEVLDITRDMKKWNWYMLLAENGKILDPSDMTSVLTMVISQNVSDGEIRAKGSRQINGMLASLSRLSFLGKPPLYGTHQEIYGRDGMLKYKVYCEYRQVPGKHMKKSQGGRVNEVENYALHRRVEYADGRIDDTSYNDYWEQREEDGELKWMHIYHYKPKEKMDRLLIVPSLGTVEWAAVEELFRRCSGLNGKKYPDIFSICKDFASRGIMGTGWKREWRAKGILDMLRNPTYKGFIPFNHLAGGKANCIVDGMPAPKDNNARVSNDPKQWLDVPLPLEERIKFGYIHEDLWNDVNINNKYVNQFCRTTGILVSLCQCGGHKSRKRCIDKPWATFLPFLNCGGDISPEECLLHPDDPAPRSCGRAFYPIPEKRKISGNLLRSNTYKCSGSHETDWDEPRNRPEWGLPRHNAQLLAEFLHPIMEEWVSWMRVNYKEIADRAATGYDPTIIYNKLKLNIGQQPRREYALMKDDIKIGGGYEYFFDGTWHDGGCWGVFNKEECKWEGDKVYDWKERDYHKTPPFNFNGCDDWTEEEWKQKNIEWNKHCIAMETPVSKGDVKPGSGLYGQLSDIELKMYNFLLKHYGDVAHIVELNRNQRIADVYKLAFEESNKEVSKEIDRLRAERKSIVLKLAFLQDDDIDKKELIAKLDGDIEIKVKDSTSLYPEYEKFQASVAKTLDEMYSIDFGENLIPFYNEHLLDIIPFFIRKGKRRSRYLIRLEVHCKDVGIPVWVCNEDFLDKFRIVLKGRSLKSRPRGVDGRLLPLNKK